MDGTEVGILEEADQVCFSGLLQGENSGTLESEVLLEVLCNLSDESLEWELSDEKLCGLLILSDLSQGDGTRSVSVGLLDSSGGGGGLPGGLGGELFAGRLASGRLASSLLGAGHLEWVTLADLASETSCCSY